MPSRPSLARVMPAVSLFMGPLRGCSNVQIAVLDGRVAAQLGARAGPDDAALLDDHVPVGEARQGVDVLVDDEDRLALALEPLQAGPDLGADQRRQPSVASSRISSFGLVISARPIASICCSPPESCAPRLARRSCSRGKSRRRARASSAARPERAAAVATRFSSHGQRRKDLPALGHEADAGLGDAVGRRARRARGPRSRSSPPRGGRAP